MNLASKAVLDRDFDAFDTADESVKILLIESLRLGHESLLLFLDSGLCLVGKRNESLLESVVLMLQLLSTYLNLLRPFEQKLVVIGESINLSKHVSLFLFKLSKHLIDSFFVIDGSLIELLLLRHELLFDILVFSLKSNYFVLVLKIAVIFLQPQLQELFLQILDLHLFLSDKLLHFDVCFFLLDKLFLR